MPKIGYSPEEWRQHLRDYAAGTFSSRRGQNPGKGSRWAVELEKIKNCPEKNKQMGEDLLRNIVKCTCSYNDFHEVSITLSI